jgi:hypothetical protein
VFLPFGDDCPGSSGSFSLLLGRRVDYEMTRYGTLVAWAKQLSGAALRRGLNQTGWNSVTVKEMCLLLLVAVNSAATASASTARRCPFRFRDLGALVAISDYNAFGTLGRFGFLPGGIT